MVPARVRHRIFDIKQALRNPDDVREYRELLSRHEANPKALIRLQQDRALALTRHAFRTSPFYREHYTRAGLDLRDLHDPQVLAALPIVERADLRDNFDRVRSRDVGPSDVEMHVTGGSTGEPLRVLWDRRLPGNAIGWRMRIGWGVHPGDPLAKVWRATRPPHERGRRLRRLRTWPSPRVTMDCTHLGEADIVRFLDEWNRIRPRLLIGFVGGLLEVAQFLLDSGRTIAPPVAIEATASPMTASQKAMLGEAFGAPVYDVYQSNEVPVMAGECTRRNGLHVFSDIRRIEIVDDDGRPVPAGAPGSVVVTDLRNRAFPIIRYRQGDVASWKVDGCGCALPFPVLNPVRGRVSDNLYFPSGHIVSGDIMRGIFYDWPDAVRQFQLVQHGDRSLTLRCVPGDNPQAESIIRRVAAGLEQTVRREVPVRLEIVDAIRHDRGKMRFIIREDAAPVPFQPAPSDAGRGDSAPFVTS